MDDKEKCPKQKKNKNKNKKQKSPQKFIRRLYIYIYIMEATQIPDAELKIMVIRMVKKLRGRIDDLTENINKEIASTKEDPETHK